MSDTFSAIPKGYTISGDRFEQVWLACSRLVLAELDCWERNESKTAIPGEPNPCSTTLNSAMSCLDKSQNWKAWDELVQCREKQQTMHYVKTNNLRPNAPDPISCHELVADLTTYRHRFFDSFVTRPVMDWIQVLEKAKTKCRSLRMKFLDCAKEMGDQSIPCLDIIDSYRDCMYKELAPMEFANFEKCVQADPNSLCAEFRTAIRYKIDSRAVEATDSLGFRKLDYSRYGGPYKAFDTMIYPLMHLPEAQSRIENLKRGNSSRL